jgi:hypothetical protein
MACGLLFVLLAQGSLAQQPAVGLLPTSDGLEIRDVRNSLSWRRCVEGMSWDGSTCQGEPLLLNRREAMQRAVDRARVEPHVDSAASSKLAHGNGLGNAQNLDPSVPTWHVPRAAELQRLIRPRAQGQGLDPRLFPNAPRSWWWTSTTEVSTSTVNPYNYDNIAHGVTQENSVNLNFLHGWAVLMTTGDLRSVHKDQRLPVLLVRTLPPSTPTEPREPRQ